MQKIDDETEQLYRFYAISELHTAGELNPGPWVKHSENVGIAAKNIAHLVPELDENKAYILGLLLDALLCFYER